MTSSLEILWLLDADINNDIGLEVATDILLHVWKETSEGVGCNLHTHH